MPHTTTKVMRTKRPDTRPNEKERRKLSRKIEDEKIIQDLRVTKKLKSERQEREVQRLPMKNELSVQEKRIRNLRKKMKKIDSLLTKQKNGDVLNQQQLACIDSLDMILQEMERYTANRSDHSINNADESDNEEDSS